ncbi:MAG: hypothetical protein ACFB4I_14155 [Cyanophyceae cyanobacterium]
MTNSNHQLEAVRNILTSLAALATILAIFYGGVWFLVGVQVGSIKTQIQDLKGTISTKIEASEAKLRAEIQIAKVEILQQVREKKGEP